MSYHGVRNWPPKWSTTRQDEDDKPIGEAGILEKALMVRHFRNKCYLVIDYQKRKYTGCLIFDDPIFCSEIHALLQSCLHCSIKEIGDTSISYML
jgi:hypothetical protein